MRDLNKQLAELSSSERISLLNETLDHFMGSKNTDAVCNVLFLMGNEYISAGELSKGRESYISAAEKFNSTGNHKGEAVSYNNLGFICKTQGDNVSALGYYSQALGIYRAAGDTKGESRSLSNIGKLFFDKGEYLKAIEYYEDAYQLKNTDDPQNTSQILVGLGISYQKANDYPRALDAFKESIELRKQLGDRRGAANSLKLTAATYLLMGEPERAEQLIMENTVITRIPGESDNGIKNGAGEIINLVDIIQNILNEKAGEAESKNVSIFYRYESDDISLIANKDTASELINRLVSFGIGHTPSGNNVFIYAGLHGGKSRCEVIDEGADLSADAALQDPEIESIRGLAMDSGYTLSHENMMGTGNTFILEFR